jgi:hypothetical protein
MYFDPETVALLRTTLDRAWASPPPSQQAVASQSILAERILSGTGRAGPGPASRQGNKEAWIAVRELTGRRSRRGRVLAFQ